MAPCIFCDIIDGRAPASVVFRDDTIMAFLDILPVNPGHLLIVPLAHAAWLDDVPDATLARMATLARRLARAMRMSTGAPATLLWLADGQEAGQEIFHVHLHVIPRYADDGFRFGYDGAHPDRETLDGMAARIAAALAAAS